MMVHQAPHDVTNRGAAVNSLQNGSVHSSFEIHFAILRTKYKLTEGPAWLDNSVWPKARDDLVVQTS